MASPAIRFKRPQPRHSALPPLTEELTRLARFAPPFRFTSFFSPEDTLLCVIAADEALHGLREPRTHRETSGTRIVELTTGSGLVGLRLIDRRPQATLLGVDIDHTAPPVARSNAVYMGLAGRARFEHATIWDPALEREIVDGRFDVLVCNPPYVPEPPGDALPVEAGAGPDGAAHVRRVIEIANASRPATLVLSWCSLCDPVGIVADASAAGYRLDALYVVAIADGEYSGGVKAYLDSLPTAFLSDAPEVLLQVAPDGAARFAYLLLAGVFRDDHSGDDTAERRGANTTNQVTAVEAVDEVMRNFVANGVNALVTPRAPFPVTCWLLDRWDEIALRAYLHGS